MAGAVEQYLKQLLTIHWLRPETALWRTFDCLLMQDIAMTGRSADLGCGDGSMSYIMAGGQVNNYDVFLDVGDLDGYNQGKDIHNVFTNRQLESDDSQLRYRYCYGIDHKAELINKTKRFRNFYYNNLVHDLNNAIPLPTEHLDAAFSNVLYWLEDIGKVLADWNRVLKVNGKLILFVPNKNFKEQSWLYYKAPHQGADRYLNFFDRGYASLIHHCYGSNQWETYFSQNGFRVVDHKPYLTDIVMKVWNIGTRPIAAPLIKLASKLSPEDRREIRREWVDYFLNFFLPIVQGEYSRECNEDECAFHFYVLEKVK